jgi:hypothetical protein
VIAAAGVVPLGGEVDIGPTPSQRGRGLCIAGGPTWRFARWTHSAGAGDAASFVRVGTLDQPDRLPPDVHIYTSSKQPWVVLPPGTPAVSEYYSIKEQWPQESLERFQAMRAARSATTGR